MRGLDEFTKILIIPWERPEIHVLAMSELDEPFEGGLVGELEETLQMGGRDELVLAGGEEEDGVLDGGDALRAGPDLSAEELEGLEDGEHHVDHVGDGGEGVLQDQPSEQASLTGVRGQDRKSVV